MILIPGKKYLESYQMRLQVSPIPIIQYSCSTITLSSAHHTIAVNTFQKNRFTIQTKDSELVICQSLAPFITALITIDCGFVLKLHKQSVLALPLL